MLDDSMLEFGPAGSFLAFNEADGQFAMLASSLPTPDFGGGNASIREDASFAIFLVADNAANGADPRQLKMRRRLW